MIKMPEDIIYRSYGSTAREARRLLEIALRKLGSFREDEAIEITEDNCEYLENCYDIMYTIEDKVGTKFSFKNFGLDHNVKSTQRFCESYQLMMTKKNSKFNYVYDFSNLDKVLESHDALRLIELHCQLNDNKIFKLIMKQYCPIKIVIEEKNKKYSICFLDNSEEYLGIILANLENFVESFRNIEVLNLENILQVFSSKEISGCYIDDNDNRLASVSFLDGKIYSYMFYDRNKKVRATLYSNNIKRQVERNIDGEICESEEQCNANCDTILNDIKMVLKNI